MSNDEKIELIERVIHSPHYSLQEDTVLSTLEGWELLNILNLQMELATRGSIVSEDMLRGCNTVGDLILLF